MVRITFYAVLCLLILSFTCYRGWQQEAAPDRRLSIAFYNLDNLFDDVDDTDHDDSDFTPAGKYHWTGTRYHQKLKNMSEVMSHIANDELPDVMGVCELESRKALADLLETAGLKELYGIEHYDSPDERGIDVGLVYNKNKLFVLSSCKVAVKLSKSENDKTRDQLFVKALVKSTKDTVCFYVCHFPSRREGKEESEVNRTDAAATARKFLDSNIRYGRQNLVIMGDFNDEPWDKSISSELGAIDLKKKGKNNSLYNLMWGFKQENRGTYRYKDEMNILDQFMISAALTDGKGMEYETGSVNILDEEWLKQKGKYKGYPLRTFGGVKWLNGYSDHFPVSIVLKW